MFEKVYKKKKIIFYYQYAKSIEGMNPVFKPENLSKLKKKNQWCF